MLCYEPICDEGPCCMNGYLLTNETVCRPAENECDVPDYCTGFSSDCTLDKKREEGTPCGKVDDPGQCVDGICFNSLVKVMVKYCNETCSKVDGYCSKNGTCICMDLFANPPKCIEAFSRGFDGNITSNRVRRSSVDTNPFQQAQSLPIQQQPTQDQWTRLTQHPVFGPVAVMVVALLILVGLGIWAVVMYRLENNKKTMKERVKVRRKSSRKVPHDTSIITDPSVSIDVE